MKVYGVGLTFFSTDNFTYTKEEGNGSLKSRGFFYVYEDKTVAEEKARELSEKYKTESDKRDFFLDYVAKKKGDVIGSVGIISIFGEFFVQEIDVL